MHGLTHRAREQGGVVAAILSLFVGAGILVVLAALVVDIGSMQVERRELQNGAEAAVMASAYECSFPSTYGRPCGDRTIAATMASNNARDGAAAVQLGDLCGSGSSSLLACTGTRTVRNCPNTPTALKWVQVTTRTLTAGGSSTLPRFFTRALPWFGPRSIAACAQAAWGPPKAINATMPVAIGQSCWVNWTTSGASYAAKPPYTGVAGVGTNPEPSYAEFAVAMGSSSGASASSCTFTLPAGGFGWLDPASSSQCTPLVTYDTISSNPGASLTGTACQTAMTNSVNALEVSSNKWNPAYYNRVALVPITDTNAGSGTNAGYHIVGFATFYMTGYSVPALGKKASARNAANECAASVTCIYGWFVSNTLVGIGEVSTNPAQGDYGLSVVQSIG